MFVYITTCLINNKKYIGKYEGKDTDKYLGSGKLLRRAIKKHGCENFTRVVLEYFNSKDEVRSAEKRYIKLYDAVNSAEFYNIAEGGEGGNTFAGIVGSDRLQLIDKLKKRKKSDKSSYKNMIACKNLYTNQCEILSQIDFARSNYHVGIACKGIYLTPFGNFSASDIMGDYIGIDYTSLVTKCKHNHKVIRKAHFQAMINDTLYYQHIRQYIGKTFKDAGFDFISIENLIKKDLVFYKELSILKNN
jgi:hypothetical protein